MDCNTALSLLSLSVQASNLFSLAVAVTEYEFAPPAAFSDLNPRIVKQGLAMLLDDGLQQLRYDLEYEQAPGLYQQSLSVACSLSAALVEAALTSEAGGEEAYDDFCNLSYTVADAVRQLAEDLQDIV